MRTPDQINNLRFVLRTFVGPGESLLTDEEINTWADNFQKQVNNIKYIWNVKVKTKDNLTLEWEDIPEEGPAPNLSEDHIKLKCLNLLKKYSQILEIKVIDVFNDEHTFCFKNKEEK